MRPACFSASPCKHRRRAQSDTQSGAAGPAAAAAAADPARRTHLCVRLVLRLQPVHHRQRLPTQSALIIPLRSAPRESRQQAGTAVSRTERARQGVTGGHQHCTRTDNRRQLQGSSEHGQDSRGHSGQPGSRLTDWGLGLPHTPTTSLTPRSYQAQWNQVTDGRAKTLPPRNKPCQAEIEILLDF